MAVQLKSILSLQNFAIQNAGAGQNSFLATLTLLHAVKCLILGCVHIVHFTLFVFRLILHLLLYFSLSSFLPFFLSHAYDS